MRAGRIRGRFAPAVAALGAGVLLAAAQPPPLAQDASAATLPTGFRETVVLSGLTNPTVVRFAADGRVFVAEKSGLIKVFDGLGDTTPTVFADLRTNVYNFWDRGLLGMALDPAFPTRPYVYVSYTYDHELGSSAPAPRWGTPGATSDPCPNPPGATSDGCVVSGRLSRLEAFGNVMTGPENVLVEDWCQQYPSHSIGSVEFGPDGKLYMSAGDGASFTFVDYGQDGSPTNPCGDPPGGVGGALTPPTAEGGALRSQDVRTTGDPTGLDGSIIRVDPDTGAAPADNPLSSSTDANARRIVAYGLRNPLRFVFRPATSELWVGDVGWNDWEEINRVTSPTDTLVENFGWPCYEGNGRQSGYDSANVSICESLYSASTATGPFFAYHHSNKVVTGEACPTGSSSIAGLSFEFSAGGGSFPAAYERGLFFADYSRDCIWVMKKGANGVPAPGLIETFVDGAANPVNVEFGPGGDLYYVDFDGGTIRRVRYDPAPTTCATGEYRAEYFPNTTLSGTAALTRCEGAIDHSWGAGSPGAGIPVDGFSARWFGRFDFPAGDTTFTVTADDGIRLWIDDELLIDRWIDQPTTTYTATRTIQAGSHEVRVEYYENMGDAVARVAWTTAASNTAPTASITAPSASTRWKVGDTISFAGSASDAEDGALPAAALSWTLILHHCPSNCHTHTIQSWSGVASGGFDAPDHDYPSSLELRLTATDSGGLAHTAGVTLDPSTVALSFASSPSGLQLTVNGSASTTPFVRTVIQGSSNSISATSPQTLGSATYSFQSWSDGGAQTHGVVAAAATYTATYTAPPANTALPIVSGAAKVGQQVATTDGTWSGSTPMTFAYQWLRCASNGGSCTPIGGASAKTYTVVATDVGGRLRASVTATNAVGSAAATSAATGPVKRK